MRPRSRLVTIFALLTLPLAAGQAEAVTGDVAGAGLVGAPPVSISVDPFAGAASFSYNFVVPPGRAGMQPDLTIVYNSTSREQGPMGLGWEFRFPYLQRSVRFGQPSMSWSDTFSLRWEGRLLDLVMVDESPTGVREYRTKIQTTLRIHSYTVMGTDTRWEVRDGKGQTYEFGNVASSPNSRLGDFFWALDRIEDAHGNYLTMEWVAPRYFSHPPSVLFPKTIRYTGNSGAGLSATNRVEFAYEQRNDEILNEMGSERDLTYRLRRVKTFAGNAVATNYLLDYNSPGTGNYESDLCSGVSCGQTTISCPLPPWGASCDNPCTASTGFCGTCQPVCSTGGGGGPRRKGGSILIPPGLGQPPGGGQSSGNVITLDSYPPAGTQFYGPTFLPSLLTRITRFNETGTDLLPPTIFSYTDDTDKNWNAAVSDVPEFFLKKECDGSDRNTDDYGVQIEDVNGDGLPDLVRGYSCRNNPESSFCGVARLTYLNQNGHWTTPDPAWQVPEDFVVHQNGGEEHATGLRIVDINGDGLPDLVRSALVREGFFPPVFIEKVWLNNGGGWTLAPAWHVPIPFLEYSFGSGDETDLGVRFADVNGDSLMDLVARRDYGSSPQENGVWLNSGSGWTQKAGWTVPEPIRYHFPGGESVDPGTRILDVNGDGLSDILRSVDWTGTSVWRLWLATRQPDASGSIWKLVTDPSSWDWYIPERFTSVSSDNGGRSYDRGVRFADVNGDSRVDLIVGRNFGTLEQAVYLHKGGKGWAYDPGWSASMPASLNFVELVGSGNYDMGVRLADMDGNGSVDFLRSINSCGTLLRERYTNRDSFSDLLASIQNGIGGSTTMAYASSTQFDNRLAGAPAGARSYLGFALPVLTSMTSDDGQTGAGHAFTSNYTYKGGFFHAGQREFRGFRYVRTDLPGGRSYREQLYAQDINLAIAPLAGAVMREAERTTIAGGGNGPVYSMTENLYDRSDTAAPIFHWLQHSDQYLFDGNTSAPLESIDPSTALKHTASETAYTFEALPDDFVRTKETRAYGDMSTTADDVYVSEDFINDLTLWRIQAPYRSQKTDAPSGAGTLLSATWIYYDGLSLGTIGAGGDKSQVESWSGVSGEGPGGPGNRVLRLGYDGFGNLTSMIDPEGHQSNADYGITDPTYTYKDAVRVVTSDGTNTVNHIVTMVHDPRLGLLTQTTSGDGTEYAQFDFFGRPLKAWTSVAPDSQALPSICYQYDLGSRPIAMTTYLREVPGSGAECGTLGMLGTATYFDGLGRKVQIQTEGATVPDPTQVTETVEFDAEGRLKKSYQPFQGLYSQFTYRAPDASVPATTFIYDERGRILTMTRPGVPPLTLSYAGWSTTAYDPEHPTIKKSEIDLDAFGRTIQRRVYDSAGSVYATVSHEYDRLGRLRFITDSVGHRTEYQYDAFGEVIYTNDPDAGELFREYDKDGNLRWVGDYQNGMTTYVYDALHRVIEKQRVDQPGVSFRYDEQTGRPGGTRPIGHLTSVEDFTYNIRREFEYDERGRGIKSRERIDGQWYEITQSLDGLGRTTLLGYPDGTSVSYIFGNDGRITGVPGFATNARYTKTGEIAHLEYANGLVLDNTYYDPTQWLQNTRAVFPSTGQVIVDNTLSYTPIGFIQGITDTIGTATQSFTLDHQYRLIQASSPSSYGTLNYQYDNLGNMTMKEGVTYTFGEPWHPHRPTGTSQNRSLTYDQVGNLSVYYDNSPTGSSRVFSYNRDGLLSIARDNWATTDSRYVYGPSGSLALRYATTNDWTTYTTTTFVSNLYEKTGTSFKKYVYLGGMRIGEWRSDGSKFFYVGDRLSSLSVVTNEAQQVVQRIEYKPYGATSAMQSNTFLASYQFAGNWRDSLSGLYNFGARFYDPELGLFLSVDPGIPNPLDFRDLNPYAYARGNPVSLVDIGGYLSVREIEIIGMIVKVGVTAATNGCVPCGAAAGAFVTGYLTAHENGEDTSDALRAGLKSAAVAGATAYATQEIGQGFSALRGGPMNSNYIGPAYHPWALQHPQAVNVLEALSKSVASGTINAAVNGGNARDVLGAGAKAAFNAYTSNFKIVPSTNWKDYWKVHAEIGPPFRKDGHWKVGIETKSHSIVYRSFKYNDLEKVIDFVGDLAEKSPETGSNFVLGDLDASIASSFSAATRPAAEAFSAPDGGATSLSTTVLRSRVGVEDGEVMKEIDRTMAVNTENIVRTPVTNIYRSRGVMIHWLDQSTAP